MGSMTEYAAKELAIVNTEGDELQNAMDEAILDIIRTFSEQGFSGYSAGYAISMLTRLLNFKPLTPLTGEDDEWVDVSEYGTPSIYQNARCSSVFKQKDCSAYDVEGKIFSEDGGKTWFSSKDSKVAVTFPYYPPTYPEKVLIEPMEVKEDVESR